MTLRLPLSLVLKGQPLHHEKLKNHQEHLLKLHNNHRPSVVNKTINLPCSENFELSTPQDTVPFQEEFIKYNTRALQLIHTARRCS
jgi:hypothetical protein